MRKMLCATALVTAALLGAGCNKGHSLVGKWNAQTQGQNVTFEFKPDNTMTIGAKGGPASIQFVGDYKQDGEKLTLTFKDVKMEGVPQAQQAMVKPLFASILNKPNDAKITFTSDDEITFSADKPAGGAATAKGAGAVAPSPIGQSMTLTRVKEGS